MPSLAFFRAVASVLVCSVGAVVGVVALAGCAEEERPPETARDGGRRTDAIDASDVSTGTGPESDAEADTSAADLDSGAPMIPDVSEVSALPDVAADVSRPIEAVCTPLKSAEPIPARSVVMSMDNGGSSEVEVFVGSELFGRFYNACGSCHVDGNFGGLKVSQLDFKPGSTKVGQNVLDRMTANDPNTVMPPISAGGAVNSQRKSGDPVIPLIKLYSQWMAAGQPADVFKVPREMPPPGNVDSYAMTPERGLAMTNIGDCVPSAGLVGMNSVSDKIAELDKKFAALNKAASGSDTSVPQRIGLPERLAETDLFTLDTATLARHRVLAYAPAYPLWSDNARKIRHVRVPAGTSIRFDRQSQTFDIPANTRFYKTFLKPVIEKGGNLRYRKVETRLIVARPDRDRTDGTFENTSLFGTYKWDDAEQEATLVTETLNNLEPFKDQLITLIMDEDKAEAVRAATPPTANLAKALEEARATRKYAIPGSDRCIQCHMGSPTKNFILGFFPLQVHRRPAGEGGILEPAGPEELSQLERFISYGVITGIVSPGDITLLESSQGERKPRNEHELDAQGYMLGNCAHCHNPRGFPSVENAVLRDVLDFLPSAAPPGAPSIQGCRKQGGIFRFPLECMSPRIQRGEASDVPIPYLTPSLMDYPTPPKDGFAYRKKGFSSSSGLSAVKPDSLVLAPWRSLVYRNVDTPFTYSDGGAIFPHMPMNVPGFDCRAPRILGDWMVSIPATRVNPSIPEDLIAGSVDNVGADLSPQPYREVQAGDVAYAKALDDARTRLTKYHDGFSYTSSRALRFSRYVYCPDTSDIQDPWVTLQDSEHLAPPDQETFSNGEMTMPSVGTPRRPHWVVTDLSQPKVTGWNPRRDDWEKVLVNHCLCNERKAECKNVDGRINKAFECTGADELPRRKQQRVIGILNPEDPTIPGVKWTAELKDFARAPLPFGIWEEKQGCDYSREKTVDQIRSQQPMAWMTETNPRADARVYSTPPGAAVFGMICINCHGLEADSRGRMADTVLTMTGGSTRVANLRDGLFGSAGANRAGVFGKAPTTNADSEDWSARYLAWMALGGTAKLLPPAVLGVVANTQVLGVKRRGVTTLADANMLATAKDLCLYTLPRPGTGLNFNPSTASFNYKDVSQPLITSNGDFELWRRLCDMGHTPPVRLMLFQEKPVPLAPFKLLRPEKYPSDTPVGNHRGGIEQGLQASNRLPWCWTAIAKDYAAAKAFAHANAVDGQDLPECPLVSTEEPLTDDEIEAWGERGAINAGLAVFVYLDDLAHGKPRQRAYNECPP